VVAKAVVAVVEVVEVGMKTGVERLEGKVDMILELLPI
jgi:hypothetical protein